MKKTILDEITTEDLESAETDLIDALGVTDEHLAEAESISAFPEGDIGTGGLVEEGLDDPIEKTDGFFDTIKNALTPDADSRLPAFNPDSGLRTTIDKAQDTLAGWGVGANQLVKMGAQLYGLTTGDFDTDAMRIAQENIDYYEGLKSQDLLDKSEQLHMDIKEADGTLSKAWVAFTGTLSDPSLAANFLTEQLPLLASTAGTGTLVGAGAKGLGATASAASKASYGTAITTGATMQGSSVGGETYERLLEENPALWEVNDQYIELLNDGLDEDTARAEIALNMSRNTALAAGAISLIVQKLPGASVLERTLAGEKLKGSIVSGAVKGFVGEGVSEGIEEGFGQFRGNVEVGKINPEQDIMEGVGEATGQGAVGGIFGGVAGAGNAAGQKLEAKKPTLPPTNLDEAIKQIDDEVAQEDKPQFTLPQEAIDAANEVKQTTGRTVSSDIEGAQLDMFNGTERRKDQSRREMIAKMTPEEVETILYENELTGIQNRRAFEEKVDGSKFVVSIDADNLKAVNDLAGNVAGDTLLKKNAAALNEVFKSQAYHISGDEFYVLGDNESDLAAGMEKFTELLRQEGMEFDSKDKKISFNGLQSTYAIAKTKKEADALLKEEKGRRELLGERTARGFAPSGTTVIDASGNIQDISGSDVAKMLTNSEATASDVSDSNESSTKGEGNEQLSKLNDRSIESVQQGQVQNEGQQESSPSTGSQRKADGPGNQPQETFAERNAAHRSQSSGKEASTKSRQLELDQLAGKKLRAITEFTNDNEYRNYLRGQLGPGKFNTARNDGLIPAITESPVVNNGRGKSVDRLMKHINKNAKARVVSIESAKQIKNKDVRQALMRSGKESLRGVKGFYMNGKIHIVEPNIKNEQDAVNVFMHEALHAGLDDKYGNKVQLAMTNLYEAIGRRAGMERLARKYDINLKPYKEMYKDSPRDYRNAVLLEELLAHINEKENGKTITRRVKELLVAIRDLLSVFGLDKVLPKGDKGDRELTRMIRTARKAFNNKNKREFNQAIRYSMLPANNRRDVMGFYSSLYAAATQIKQEKNTPAAMLAALKKTPGVKQEELDWTGLQDWLENGTVTNSQETPKKSVTKDEILTFLLNNGVEIDEVVLKSEGANNEDDLSWGDDEPDLDQENWLYRVEDIADDLWSEAYFESTLAEILIEEVGGRDIDTVPIPMREERKAQNKVRMAYIQTQMELIDPPEYESDFDDDADEVLTGGFAYHSQHDYSPRSMMRRALEIYDTHEVAQVFKNEIEETINDRAEERAREDYENNPNTITMLNNTELDIEIYYHAAADEYMFKHDGMVIDSGIRSESEARLQAFNYLRDNDYIESSGSLYEEYIQDEPYENYEETLLTFEGSELLDDPHFGGAIENAGGDQNHSVVAFLRTTHRKVYTQFAFEEEPIGDFKSAEEIQKARLASKEFNGLSLWSDYGRYVGNGKIAQATRDPKEIYDVFYVDEVQSDWHQKGRQEGYQGIATDTSFEQDGVPDAPFKNDAWLTLAMRKAVIKAIEDGKGHIAWPDAETMIDRWSESYSEMYNNVYDRKIPNIIKKILGNKPMHSNGLWIVEIPAEKRTEVRERGLPKFKLDSSVEASKMEAADYNKEFISVNDDGTVDAIHFSESEELTVTDPKMHGKGIRGEELLRKASDPKNWVDRTYFGIKGYRKEPGLKGSTFTAKLNANNLYDIIGDPDGLRASATEDGTLNVTLYERLIKNAGYTGYYNDTHSVVAMFSKIKVTKVDDTLNQFVFGIDPVSQPIEPGKDYYKSNRGTHVRGMPDQFTVNGESVVFTGLKTAQDAAAKYMKKSGVNNPSPKIFAAINKERARRIADAYDNMAHTPTDPATVQSYNALVKETYAQYDAILATGLKVEFNPEGEIPYPNPREAILDVVRNNHLYIFPTRDGYGSDEVAEDNVMLEESPYKFKGETALANDVFRVVHDYFGHIQNGNGFRARGEEHAWRSHSAMYSKEALPAMTAETRGQNSWVNFGPHAQHNAAADGGDTIYADQKMGILPEWVWQEGVTDEEAVAEILQGDLPKFSVEEETEANQLSFDGPHMGVTRIVLRKMQDKFVVLKNLQRIIVESGGVVGDEQNAYQAETLFHGKVEEDMRRMMTELVEPMTIIMAKYNINQEQLDQFLYAMHAPERNKYLASIYDTVDNPSGMSDERAKEIIDGFKASGDYEGLLDAAMYVYEMVAQQREALRDGALLDNDTIDEWQKRYEFYVPLKGFAIDETTGKMPKTGKGFSIGGKEFKHALGRESEAASPSGHAIKDLTEKLIRKRKNEVGLYLLSLIEKNPNADYWNVYTDENPKYGPGTRAQYNEDTLAGKKTRADKDKVTAVPLPMAMMGDKFFAVKREGKVHYIELEEDLLRAMTNMGVESTNILLRAMAWYTRMLSALNTSFNPEFIVSNFSRDIQTAVLNLNAEMTKEGGLVEGEAIAKQTVKDVPKAMKAVYKVLRNGSANPNNKWEVAFEEFREAGAKTGYYDMKDIAGMQKDLQTMIAHTSGGIKVAPIKAFKSVGKFVDDLNGSVENAIRLAAFVNAREVVSEQKAAVLAKDMTVNFNRRGEAGTALNSLYMFTNASVQGTANFARAMHGLKGDGSPRWKNLNRAQKIAAAVVGFSASLAMINRMAAGEDDDGVNWYQKVPNYVKERNFVIMRSTFGGPQDGTFFKIPMPYGYNIFAVMGNAMEDTIANGTDGALNGAKNVTLGFLGSFAPLGFSESESASGALMKNATPTAFKPVVEVIMNENFFGSTVYNTPFPGSIPDPQSHMGRLSTPEFYKNLTMWMNEKTGGTENISGFIDKNPDIMAHYVNTIAGGAGNFATRKVFGNLEAVYNDIPVETHRIPFVSRLYGKVLPYEDVGKFYDRRDKLGQIIEERKDVYATGDQKKIAAFKKKYDDEVKTYKELKAAEKKLKALRKKKRKAYASNKTPAEIHVTVKAIEEEYFGIINQFNKKYNMVIGR